MTEPLEQPGRQIAAAVGTVRPKTLPFGHHVLAVYHVHSRAARGQITPIAAEFVDANETRFTWVWDANSPLFGDLFRAFLLAVGKTEADAHAGFNTIAGRIVVADVVEKESSRSGHTFRTAHWLTPALDTNVLRLLATNMLARRRYCLDNYPDLLVAADAVLEGRLTEAEAIVAERRAPFAMPEPSDEEFLVGGLASADEALTMTDDEGRE